MVLTRHWETMVSSCYEGRNWTLVFPVRDLAPQYLQCWWCQCCGCPPAVLVHLSSCRYEKCPAKLRGTS